jgi:hypothetical protein
MNPTPTHYQLTLPLIFKQIILLAENYNVMFQRPKAEKSSPKNCLGKKKKMKHAKKES